MCSLRLRGFDPPLSLALSRKGRGNAQCRIGSWRQACFYNLADGLRDTRKERPLSLRGREGQGEGELEQRAQHTTTQNTSLKAQN